MGTMHFTGRSGDVVDVGGEAVERLRASIRGEVILPGDDGYDTSRAVWNGMIDRRPGAVVRCAGAADVVTALRFALDHELRLAVRGGGHNVAGNAVCDGGLVIDQSLRRGVRVRPSERSVHVDAGALWAEVDAETQAFGLATTGGTVSHTGVAGLTLGGGLGHLCGLHGYSCDNLVSVDVVLADGRYIHVDDETAPDLMWAMRGAGANLGVVTGFEFALHPVGPVIWGGLGLFPAARAPEVLRCYRDLCPGLPDEAALHAAFVPSPDGDPMVAVWAVWFGSPDGGEALVAPVRALGPVVDGYGPMPYVAMQQLIDEAVPHGLPRYWKSGYLEELSDDLIEAAVEHNARKLTPISPILFFRVGGEAARRPVEATAFPHRRTEWDSDIIAQWTEPDQADASIGWVREAWAAFEPHSSAVYVNHLSGDDSRARVRSAYGANWDRLVEVKAKYDPENVFRLNNNIPPR